MDIDPYSSYTQAQRHPVIIGHIAGWRLPWTLSASQLGAIAYATELMLVTRPVWAHSCGGESLCVQVWWWQCRRGRSGIGESKAVRRLRCGRCDNRPFAKDAVQTL